QPRSSLKGQPGRGQADSGQAPPLPGRGRDYAEAMMSAPRILFRAVLTPHRSLSPQGFRLLMTALAAASIALGAAFLSLGAWPVVGYFGLDVLLVYLAFRASYRSGLAAERVELTEAELTVSREEPAKPPRVWTFQPFWLRVTMDDPPRHDSQVTLSSHGRHL